MSSAIPLFGIPFRDPVGWFSSSKQSQNLDLNTLDLFTNPIIQPLELNRLWKDIVSVLFYGSVTSPFTNMENTFAKFMFWKWSHRTLEASLSNITSAAEFLSIHYICVSLPEFQWSLFHGLHQFFSFELYSRSTHYFEYFFPNSDVDSKRVLCIRI